MSKLINIVTDNNTSINVSDPNKYSELVVSSNIHKLNDSGSSFGDYISSFSKVVNDNFITELSLNDFTLSETRGYINTDGTIKESNNWVLAYYVAPNDFDLWCGNDVTTSTDIFLGVWNNGNVGNKDDFISPRYRRKPSTSTDELPTESNKLRILKGQAIGISLYNGGTFLANTSGCYKFTEISEDIKVNQKNIDNQLLNYLSSDMISRISTENTLNLISRTDPGVRLYSKNKFFNLDGSLIDLNNYDLYSFYAFNDFDLWYDDDYGGSVDIAMVIYDGIVVGENTAVKRLRRKSSGEDTFPTSSNKLRISRGQTVAISFKLGINVDNFLVHVSEGASIYSTLNYNYIVSNDSINSNSIGVNKILKSDSKLISNKCNLVYNSGNNGSLEISIPTGSGYHKYNFNHSVSDARNCDTWNILNIENNDISGNLLYNIITNGELEFAVSVVGSTGNQFLGGNTHGNELVTSIGLLIDGRLVNPSDVVVTEAFNNLIIIVNSELQHPETKIKVGNHYKKYLFTKDKFILDQSVEWVTDLSVTSSYLGMFPVAKYSISGDPTSIKVTDSYYGYNDQLTEIPEVTTLSDPIGIPIHLQDSSYRSNIVIFGNSSKFSVDINFVNTGTPETQHYMFTDNSGGNYNKFYNIVNSNTYTITTGTVWKSIGTFKLSSNY